MNVNRALSYAKLALVALAVSLVSATIGVREVSLGPFIIVFFPLLYSFLLALIVNPNVTGVFSRLLSARDYRWASAPVIVLMLPFIAKFGTIIGTQVDTILSSGIPLILNEAGNLGTILLAFPIAVKLLKLRREAIGATFSVARETSVAIIADKFSLRSPEGTGVMAVYVVGTMFGTLMFAILPALAATIGAFDTRSLAIACGVGSGTMTAACAGSLSNLFPSEKDNILALAGASNLLTTITGLYVSLLITLPLVEFLYRRIVQKNEAHAAVVASSTSVSHSESARPPLADLVLVLLLGMVISYAIHIPSHGAIRPDIASGLVSLTVIALVGVFLGRTMPFRLPDIAWVSALAIALAVPGSPVSTRLLPIVAEIDLLLLAVPALAFAGLAVGRSEIRTVKESGWKLLIVALLVFVGTYFGSATIAELSFRMLA